MRTSTQLFLTLFLSALTLNAFGQKHKPIPANKGVNYVAPVSSKKKGQTVTSQSVTEFSGKTGIYNARGEEIIRCGTVEINEKYNTVDANGQTRDQRFETWMASRMDDIKAKMAASKTAAVVYTIPTVVHVIHETGTPIGTAENISDAQVMSQMDVLNEDFQRLNADATNTPAAFLPVAADCQIEFCMAAIDPIGNPTDGINRVVMDGAPWASGDVDNIIKPATQWNPVDYFNMWSVDIGGGLLGWAQLPDEPTPAIGGIGASGPANQDGVVNLASSMGRPPASSAPGPYNYGRTATHEVGHWLGLRHIWGDGNCAQDDFCGDTPGSNGSNFGCPNVNNCVDAPTNHPDMVENYMDYSDDLCMNIFTLDQKARMFAVMDPSTGSARRNTLPGSGKCDLSPRVSFANANTYIDESSPVSLMGCRFAGDLDIQMNIGGPPTGDANITVSVLPGATATLGIDYDLIVTAGTFANGDASPINMTVRIYGDTELEADEFFVLQYTISGATDAFTGTSKQTDSIWILNDDVPPVGVFNATIFTENFDAAPTGDVVHLGYNGFGVFHDAGNNDWMYGGNSVFGNKAAYISRNSNANIYLANSASISYFETPFIDPTTYTGLVFEYDWSCVAEPGWDYGMLTITADDVNWFNLFGPMESVAGQTHQVVPIPAMFEGAPFKISFDWLNDGSISGDPPLAVDNLLLTASNNQPVETVLSVTEDQWLGPNADVFFYNPGNGNVMVRVTNLTNFDYGCTNIEVDRAGTAAVLYDDPDIQYAGTQKTYYVNPTNNNPAGSYVIRLYYTEAEIGGWESVTGRSRNDIQISKTNGNVSNITPAAPNANGPGNVNSTAEVRGTYTNTPNDFWVEGTFTTGFSGFVARVPSALAIEYGNFELEKVNNDAQLSWEVEPSASITNFEILRSTNGYDFNPVGDVGFEGGTSTYNYTDLNINTHNAGVLYYRIRGYEVDGSFTETEIKTISLDFSAGVSVFPSPFMDEVSISYVGTSGSIAWVSLYDLSGKVLSKGKRTTQYGQNTITLNNLGELTSGVYFVKILSDGNEVVRKVVKE